MHGQNDPNKTAQKPDLELETNLEINKGILKKIQIPSLTPKLPISDLELGRNNIIRNISETT